MDTITFQNATIAFARLDRVEQKLAKFTGKIGTYI